MRNVSKNGADVNAKSKQYAGWSPLFFAIKEGHLKIAKLLLANKASMTTKDQYEQTPLGFAFSHKKDIYQSLISKGNLRN
ncbi:BRCA1-associated RING domain protein 1-like isoform X2 [Halichondria panicea]|uniref:BRCA1-associated RING domain protein 1-like isoform X2 n=1 Tax=Halichondria panicea TaxID=6063 RepID=UPI00312BC844